MNEIQRCRLVLGRVGGLPEAEKDLAEILYLLILRIELFHWSWPNSCGWLAVGLGALMAMTTGLRIPLKGSWEMAGIAVFYMLVYLLGFLASKVLIFNWLRDRTLREIRNLQISNSGFSKVLGTLKEMDPRIEANVGKLLPLTY
jgi:hypothetical protein